jgi:alanyl-tRNA synthetase
MRARPLRVMPTLARAVEPGVHGVRPAAGRVPLPFPSVDTGLGLERLASVLQQVPSNFDTDLFTPIHARMRQLLGHDPDAFEAERFSYQVIADHSRAITFLIADGVLPSNEGRGYVLRRIVRRAVRHGRLLGRTEPFLAETADVVIETMREAYPYLVERRAAILAAIAREEIQFARTLDAGMIHLEEALIPLTGADRLVGRRAEDLPGDAPVLAGPTAFRLHDTYGFPVDLTVELAAEYGVAVDRPGFDQALDEQRDRSRGGRKAELARHAELMALYDELARRLGDTRFLGYDTTTAEGRVVAILRDGLEFETLESVGDAELRTEPSAEAEVILDQTPFYAEGGGQVGDWGVLRLEPASTAGRFATFEVVDTQRPAGGLIVHRGRLHGRLAVGDTLTAEVDAARRARTMRNHTGTHILHRALRNVVGEGARQAGSLVTPEGLRFDFPLDRGLTDEERRRIEDEARRIIREDRPVTAARMAMREAIEAGADAFFDEKYGETVRTIRVEGYSHELCGGTHCRASGQVGGFLITSERSIGSGMRRIEALTGDGADAYVAERLEILRRAGGAVGATAIETLPDRVTALQEELKEARRRVRTGAAAGLPKASDLAGLAAEVAPGLSVVTFAGPFESIETMKGVARELRGLLPSGVIALGLDADEPHLFVTVSPDLVARGLAAGTLVQQAVAQIDGRGGGRPEMAQGKGSRRGGLAAALADVSRAVAAQAGSEVGAEPGGVPG